MFKAIKDNKIIAISDTDSTFLCLVCDSIANEPEHTTADYIQVNGEYVLTSSAEAIEQREAEARAERDRMIDVFEWRISRNNDERELGSTETDNRELLLKYREYLRHYPETENWYEQNPLTFEEWKGID